MVTPVCINFTRGKRILPVFFVVFSGEMRVIDIFSLKIYTWTANNRELLRLKGIKKHFGTVDVLRGLDLSVGQGEFITLLGSSGCGKTTTLRIIAGLESADEGQVFIDGVDVSALEPNKRGVNMVFQNYALFPHMNVEQNTAYSLRLRGVPKHEIRQAVAEALSLVQLSGFEKRMPEELSGGQRQRVAVARAIINRPKVLLLDEPLGALDLQLRRQMQLELKRLQKQLGITFVYITHDQEEALTMSDRIAVMRNGVFEQVGGAADVYKYPKTGFVARFVGGANVFSGRVVSHGPATDNGAPKTRLVFDTPAGRASLEYPDNDEHAYRGIIPGETEIHAAVREEHILLDCSDGLAAEVTGINFAGGMLRITVRLINNDGTAGEEICASHTGIDDPLQIGDRVRVNWNPGNAVMVEPDEAAGSPQMESH
jgi:spermidine/putrescine transport system ATP-binding protein